MDISASDSKEKIIDDKEDDKLIDKLSDDDIKEVNYSIDTTCLEKIEEIRQAAEGNEPSDKLLGDLGRILLKWIIVRSSYRKANPSTGIRELGEAIVESTNYVVNKQDFIVEQRDVLRTLLKKLLLDIVPNMIRSFYEEAKADDEHREKKEKQLYFQEKEELENYIKHTKDIIELKL